METIHQQVTRNQSQGQDGDGDGDEHKEIETKNRNDTKSVLDEVRNVIGNAGQYFEAPGARPNETGKKDQHRQTNKSERKVTTTATGGFKGKGPKQLLDFVNGQVANYRKNGEKFGELQARVKAWHGEPAIWAIVQNKKEAALSLEKRQEIFMNLAEERERLRRDVEQKMMARLADEELYRIRKEKKEKDDKIRIKKMIKEKHRAAANEKADRIAKVGLLCAVIGARAGPMFMKMIHERPIREKFKKHTKAARTIQKFVRPIIWRKKGKVIRRGLTKLKALIESYHMRWSIRRAKKATEVVITFTKEMSQQSEMKTAMMNYVRHIKRLQRVWRRYCIWKDYILEVRREQFEAVEVQCVPNWEKRKIKIEKELSAAASPDPDAIIGDFNMRRPPHRISEAIREQLLMESFREDQAQMRPLLANFNGDLEEFRLKITTWKSMIEAQQIMNQNKSMKQIMKDEPPPDRPRRPIVTPKLSDDDLWIIIKKGHQRMDELIPEVS